LFWSIESSRLISGVIDGRALVDRIEPIDSGLVEGLVLVDRIEPIDRWINRGPCFGRSNRADRLLD
jgi:hypothetical protein